LKNLSSHKKLHNLINYNHADDALAKELFSKGYTVVKKFASLDDIDKLISVGLQSIQSTNNPDSNYFSYGKIKILNDDIYKKIIRKRVSICLQPNSDGLLLQRAIISDWCRHKDIINDSVNIDKITNKLSKEGWAGFIKYIDGEYLEPHIDGPGEIQSLLYLTKKGIDYSMGGLCFTTFDDENLKKVVCVDDLVESGDLVFFNANKRLHWVKKIIAKKNQRGRMIINVHGNPAPYLESHRAHNIKNYFEDIKRYVDYR